MTKPAKPATFTDDELFEITEYLALVATDDPDALDLYQKFSRRCRGLESPGWKKGKGMSQQNKILKMLKEGRTLTRLKAFHYGIMNLTARISDLRNAGYDVRCRWKEDADGNSYGEFYLEEGSEAAA